MKTKITFLICSAFLMLNVYAQDVLTFNNKTEIKVKVVEVTATEVKYKKFENLDGPTYIAEKTDVYMIKYENGTYDYFYAGAPAQNGTAAPDPNKPVDDDEIVAFERRHYGGPRLGMTMVTPGAFEDALLAENKRTVYSQMGWQFETRLFSLKSGLSGLFEFVPCIGGMDMGKFIPSVSALVGLRTKKGFELGGGPNIGFYNNRLANLGNGQINTSFGMVFAAGMSFKSGNIVFPINLAFVPSVGKVATIMDPITHESVQYKYQTGAKITLLIGFNSRNK